MCIHRMVPEKKIQDTEYYIGPLQKLQICSYIRLHAVLIGADILSIKVINVLFLEADEKHSLNI